MFNKVRIQKKQITHCKKGSKKQKQIYFVLSNQRRSIVQHIIPNTYRPFSNLALCPKQVIAFVQNPVFDFEGLETTINNLKMPSQMKRTETLIKMRKLANQQEDFKNIVLMNQSQYQEQSTKQINSFETMSQTLDNSFSESLPTLSLQHNYNNHQEYIYNNQLFFKSDVKNNIKYEEVNQLQNSNDQFQQINYIESQSPQIERQLVDLFEQQNYFNSKGITEPVNQQNDFNHFLNL